ncbi:MAG: thioredoxin domain-containing protein [Candidatus Hodarchaeales archaeon]|jgi:uncharacterized protein YyaL (SSP411 family)
MSSSRKANQLIHETSPYLLKHAYNPVNWYSWCEEAFERSEMENKPIFVSIGYYSCHWCNVMEKESFEDFTIAEFLNKYFISIKVDREELPDVDHQYQLVYQLMNGRGGGWPLTVFITPDKVPFFTGTYFPPKSKMGLPGFLELLKQIENAYRTQQSKIHSSKDSIKANIKSIQERLRGEIVNSIPEIKIVEDAALELASTYDKNNTGFGSAPKFPHESALMFLLSEGIRTNNKAYIKIVKYTLESMCGGGIYDQLGGGFHRYSVDDYWLVPHFEKMLYNQALMSETLLDMYQITNEKYFLNKAVDTLSYVLRELKNPSGGFFSGADADSEGIEGKYFVWNRKEILSILGDNVGEIFCYVFGISNKGNWEGTNILNVSSTLKQASKKFNKSEEELKSILKDSKNKLFNFRSKRIAPGIDKKILSGWSSLLVKPLLRASSILSTENEKTKEFSDTAKLTLDFIKDFMIREGLLYRVYGFSDENKKIDPNNAKILGYLEDYIYVALAFIEGFEHFLKYEYFETALYLTYDLVNNFWDDEAGGFYSSRKAHNTPLQRYKDIFDSPLPSPNAIAIVLFHKLYYFTEDSNYLEYANKILIAFNGAALQRSGLGMASYFQSLAWSHSHSTEIIMITNEKSKNTKNNKLWKFLQQIYIPSRIQLRIDNNLSNLPKEFLDRSWIQGKSMKNDQETLYVCKDFVCSAPITNIEELKQYLQYQFNLNLNISLK